MESRFATHPHEEGVFPRQSFTLRDSFQRYCNPLT